MKKGESNAPKLELRSQYPELDKYLAFGYRGAYKVEFGSDMCRLWEGGKLTLEVATTPDVQRVFDHLLMALHDKRILAHRLLDKITFFRDRNVLPDNTIKRAVLEAAADLLQRRKVRDRHFIGLVKREAEARLKKQKAAKQSVTARYVRRVIDAAGKALADSPLEIALVRALNEAVAPSTGRRDGKRIRGTAHR